MEVSEIIEQVDIVEYISQFCDLEERNGELWGLSPLKQENTPSFSINREKQIFYDFSSGAGGTVLDFIMAQNQCGLTRAVKILKQYANINEGEQPARTRLLSSGIAKKYRPVPKPQKESKAVILPKNHMRMYNKDSPLLSVWEDEGISYEVLKKHQVAYDEISNRIVYPIKNLEGQIINVCGRTLDPDYKSKGLSKYIYFKPLGTLNTLYGFSDNLEAIKAKKEIIIFEGAKSVMLAETWGVDNTCAILTSHLNQNQFEVLVKLGARVVLALDKDVDLRKDAFIQKLKRYVTVEAIIDKQGLLEPKMSPVDAGFEVWQILYERRKSLN